MCMYDYWGFDDTPHVSLPMTGSVPDKQLEATYEVEKPLYHEPILAWRSWRIERYEGDLLLRSVTYRVFWPRREELKAGCQGSTMRAPNEHDAPDFNHSCGIYSVKDKEDAVNWANYHSGTEHVRVIGEVKIWGRVFQYEKGYIAQYAYPSCIYLPMNAPTDKLEVELHDLMFEIATAYEIPVELGW